MMESDLTECERPHPPHCLQPEVSRVREISAVRRIAITLFISAFLSLCIIVNRPAFKKMKGL